jgi:hypothetical protein
MRFAGLHPDEVTEENDLLRVIPGSHHTGKELRLSEVPRTILAGRGNVLFIRPLVAHCSNRSQPDTRWHRRILHFEFAATAELSDGYAWHDFVGMATVHLLSDGMISAAGCLVGCGWTPRGGLCVCAWRNATHELPGRQALPAARQRCAPEAGATQTVPCALRPGEGPPADVSGLPVCAHSGSGCRRIGESSKYHPAVT